MRSFGSSLQENNMTRTIYKRAWALAIPFLITLCILLGPAFDSITAAMVGIFCVIGLLIIDWVYLTDRPLMDKEVTKVTNSRKPF